ncbi:hypothetical protein VTL71DRAFT_10015 [Oculimacula yallundae]|uniref:FAD-binding PCMH-type domain-containing protein n=1 Tax=Oculimacula yallundae TaxID=86028 RepID=A0ABR4BQ30_9HELO
MGLSLLKSIVLLCTLAIDGIRGQLDAQIPLGTFQGNGTDTCHDACTALTTSLGSKVHHNTSLPDSLFSGYYTLMARSTIPLCIIHPTSAEDVSDAIKIISAHSCIFAVKSGGHSMFPGAATAKGGIVLDLHLLNGLKLDMETQTAFVGTGNRWGAVYEFLEPSNLTVVGGRVSDVGVGGFLLGGMFKNFIFAPYDEDIVLTEQTGGISFISRKYGWGCDNVRSYEIVLANGTIANINYASHPDLYFALRGGGKNFGIVTRFDLETHPKLYEWWGGFNFMFLTPSAIPLISSRIFSPTLASLTETAAQWAVKLACKLGYCVDLKTLTEAMAGLPFDNVDETDAAGYFAIIKPANANIYAAATHALHTGGLTDTPSFAKQTKKINTKALKSTLRTKYTNSFIEECDGYNPVGVRMSYYTATFKVNATFLEKVVGIYSEEIERIRFVNGLSPGFTLQTLHRDEIKMFGRNGGNALGIKEEDGPLTILLVPIGWADEADDELVIRTSQTIIDRSVELGKKMGVHHPFIYQNYAGKGQDIFAGYGVENQERLRRIQMEVDPQGVFVKLQPGYFSL